MDMLDKKLIRERQKALEQVKEDKEETKIVISKKYQFTHDIASTTKYTHLWRSPKSTIGYVLYNLSLVPKKSHCVIGMKDQLLNISTGRILRGENCWLEESGQAFCQFIEHVILDLNGFECRIEKVEDSGLKKSIFIGGKYPIEEVYILKMSLLGQGNNREKTLVYDDSDIEFDGYRCTREYGFILGLNNLRQFLQC